MQQRAIMAGSGGASRPIRPAPMAAPPPATSRHMQSVAARSSGGRVKAKAKDEAVKTLDTGLDVAKESKGIIAATAGALLVWVFRAPLFNLAKELFAPAAVQDGEPTAETQQDEEPSA